MAIQMFPQQKPNVDENKQLIIIIMIAELRGIFTSSQVKSDNEVSRLPSVSRRQIAPPPTPPPLSYSQLIPSA